MLTELWRVNPGDVVRLPDCHPEPVTVTAICAADEDAAYETVRWVARGASGRMTLSSMSRVQVERTAIAAGED